MVCELEFYLFNIRFFPPHTVSLKIDYGETYEMKFNLKQKLNRLAVKRKLIYWRFWCANPFFPTNFFV